MTNKEKYSFRLVNKRGTFLSAFHSNGGWSIGDVFPCSKYSWLTFYSQEEAEEYLLRLKNESIEQKERWGDWLNTALKFINTLSVGIFYYN